MKQAYFNQLQNDAHFPQQISEISQYIIEESSQSVISHIYELKLRINQISEAYIDKSVLDKLNKLETDRNTATEKQVEICKRKSVESIISRRTKLKIELEGKKAECEQFTKQITMQANNIKAYYDSIKLKKIQLEKIREQEERKSKEAAEQSRVNMMIVEKNKKHQQFIDQLEQRRKSREKYTKSYKKKGEDRNSTTRNIDCISTNKSQKAKSSKTFEYTNSNITGTEDDITDNKSIKLKDLHTSFERNAALELKKSKHMHTDKKKELAFRIEKMKASAIIFQTLHKPTIDYEKKKQLQTIIERSIKPTKNIAPKEITGNNVKPWRHNISHRPKPDNDISLPAIFKYPNYLDDSKKNAATGLQNSASKKKLNDLIENPNMSLFEKYDAIKPQLCWIEEQAKMVEENITVSKDLDDNSYEKASNYYIRAINAKLSLLGQMKDGIE